MMGNGHMCKHFNVWTSTRRNKGMKSHLTSSNNYDLQPNNMAHCRCYLKKNIYFDFSILSLFV